MVAPISKGPITQAASVDLLLLKALYNTLSEYLDPSFSDLSHGFRPRRGCRSFFSDMNRWSDLRLLQKSDVVSCFDRIPRVRLLNLVGGLLGPKNVLILDLVSSFLSTPIKDKTGRTVSTAGIGIPQGNSLSPILMNVYLNSIDIRMQELVTSGELFYLRYADDILIGIPMHSSVRRCMNQFHKAVHALELSVKIFRRLRM